MLNLCATVNAYGDRGLLGVAVDSAFASNHFIYLLYTLRAAAAARPDGSGPMVSRLSRFTLNDDNSVTNATTILGSYISGPCPAASNDVDCIPSDDTSHSIGTVLSAPDGTLYVGSGDAASYNVVDPLALRTYDERSLAGKILHVDRNGNGLPGHAMCASESNLTRVCTKLHAKGFRNPFRFALRPGGGLVVGDVGWNTQEEVDLIASAGGNYGWPCYEAKLRTPGYKDRSECAAEYAKEGTANADRYPTYDYAHAGTGAAVLGGPEYTGDQYPAGYRGTVFVGDYAKGFVRRLVVNGAGARDERPGLRDRLERRRPRARAERRPRLRELRHGRARHRLDQAHRLHGRQPRAHRGGDARRRRPARRRCPVAFDASGSTDPDGDALTYAWTFGDGDDRHGRRSRRTPTRSSGVYSATVTVSDGRGQSDSRTVTITVGSTAPQPVISAPADGALYDDGSNVQLQGSATDQQDGTLPASALTWDIVLHHNDHVAPGHDDHRRRVAGLRHARRPRRRQLLRDHADRARLGRPDGHEDDHDPPADGGTEPRELADRRAGVLLRRRPQTPFTTQSAVGYRTSISAADSFVKSGRRWVFDHWSDGGARLHDITVPASAVTYTAVYRDAGVAGPVLALAFDEGSGTTTADATGLGGTRLDPRRDVDRRRDATATR